jgi:hypothetical protein
MEDQTGIIGTHSALLALWAHRQGLAGAPGLVKCIGTALLALMIGGGGLAAISASADQARNDLQAPRK